MKDKKVLGVIIGGVILLLLLVLMLTRGKKTEEKQPALSGTTPAEEKSEKNKSLLEILSQGKKIVSVKYEMVITSQGQPSLSQKVWLKGKKMRTEMVNAGQEIINLIDTERKIIYTYFPDQNMAMKMEAGKEETTQSPLEQLDMEKYNPKVLGTEIVDGKNCLVVEYSTEGATTKVWVWKEKGFPVKVETTQGGKPTVIEYKNIEFGDISDSLFELPAGVKIAEFPRGQ